MGDAAIYGLCNEFRTVSVICLCTQHDGLFPSLMYPQNELALTDTIDSLARDMLTNLRCRAACPRHTRCHSPPLRHKDTENVMFRSSNQ